MKKNVVFTVCVIMLLSLCACGNPSRASETDSLALEVKTAQDHFRDLTKMI